MTSDPDRPGMASTTVGRIKLLVFVIQVSSGTCEDLTFKMRSSNITNLHITLKFLDLTCARVTLQITYYVKVLGFKMRPSNITNYILH